jgi:hypothetical protein
MKIEVRPAHGMILFSFDGHSVLLDRALFDKLLMSLFTFDEGAMRVELLWAGHENRYTTKHKSQQAKYEFMVRLKSSGLLPSLSSPKNYVFQEAIRAFAPYMEAQWQMFAAIGYDITPVDGANNRIVRIEVLESSLLPKVKWGRLFGFEPQGKLRDVVQFEENAIQRLSGTIEEFQVETTSELYLFSKGALRRTKM